jgi:Methyltransferase domain
MTSSTDAISRRTEVATAITRLAPNLDKNTGEVLADMYSAEELYGTVGDQPINIDPTTRISIAQGAQINQIIRQSETIKSSLEIGFAYGFSTVWILDALRSREALRHVAIDPFEITQWGGVGLHQVKRLSVESGFEWIGEESIQALPRFIKTEEKFDFILIDGNHRFDDVLVDFYLSDQLVSPGGFLAFDDMWMLSIRTVVSFILTNRQYKIVPQSLGNMIVLEKLADDNRDWRHFEYFKVFGAKQQPMLALKQKVLQIARTIRTEGILRQIQSKYRGQW